MRPDHYLRMVEAYYYNEQKSWKPWRMIATMLVNMGTEEGKSITEQEFMWLPFFDTPEVTQEYQPIKLTTEEILSRKKRDGMLRNG